MIFNARSITTALAAVLTTAQKVSAASAKTYTLATEFSGPSFFENFTSYTGADPTNGQVKYTTSTLAAKSDFAGFTSRGNAIIGVDDKTVAPDGRQALRLTSKQTVSSGSLSIFDIHHIPVGCGTWPALWFLGSGDQPWPANGEVDIVETVNSESYSSQTLHTSPGCSVDNSTAFSGELQNSDCNTGNAGLGCSVANTNYKSNATSPSSSTFATAGEGFNAQAGGVYAYEWAEDSMTIWLFPRNAIPADIASGTPNPATWTQKQKPLAKFSGPGCDFTKAFQDMQLIINTDFCGDWAGKAEVWQESGCAASTKAATCDDYVANNPQAFTHAFWEIASIRIYTAGASTVGQGPDPNAAAKKRSAANTGPRSSTATELRARQEGSDHTGCADAEHVPASWRKELNATVSANGTVASEKNGDLLHDLVRRLSPRAPSSLQQRKRSYREATMHRKFPMSPESVVLKRRHSVPQVENVDPLTLDAAVVSQASTEEVVGWGALAALGFVVAALV